MKKPPAAPGSIADVLARLELWCTRSDHGFIRITYDDGAARDLVVDRLEKALQGGIPAFHRLHLAPAATPQILAERLAGELKRLGPGVVSITGIEASLPPTADATEAALRSLNAARESFVFPEQHTLWWFPRYVSQALIREHHDLNSWFLKRVDLSEKVAGFEESWIDQQWHEALRLKDAGQFDEAIQISGSLLTEEERRLGPNHPRVAVALNNLAQLFQTTNRHKDAEPLMNRVLAIDEAIFGPRHPLVAVGLNNLARLFQDTNRLREAEPLMRRALAIDEASYGSQHPKVAIRLNNLAMLLRDMKRLGEAEPLMRRALAIDEANYGPQHPDVAVGLNNLALLFHETNRFGDAELLMRRALEIDEASYGSQNPKLAIRLNNLARLYQDTHRPTEAELLMQRALAIDEASYGLQHPNVARDLSNLAMLLKETSRLDEAELLMKRALWIAAFSLGLEHPNTQAVLNNYQHLLTTQNLPPEEIEKRVQEVLAEAEKK